MAIAYTFDPGAGFIRVVGHGAVTLDDRVGFVRDLLADPGLPERAAVLIDVSRVTPPPSADEVAVIGVLIGRLQARFGGRVAIVNAAVGHVTVSHLVTLTPGVGRGETRAFCTEAAAREWLDGP